MSEVSGQDSARLAVRVGIIAGGRGERLRADGSLLKALLPSGPEPDAPTILDAQLALIAELGQAPPLISAQSPEPFAARGLAVFPDPGAPAGPLAGIVTLLERCEGAALLALPSDVPELRAALLRKLITLARQTGKSVACRRDGRIEPLPAVYAPELLEPARRALAAGQRSPSRLLAESAAVLTLDEPEWASEDSAGASFRSINTPEALAGYIGAERAARLLASSPRPGADRPNAPMTEPADRRRERE